jgi:hypothetical protein
MDSVMNNRKDRGQLLSEWLRFYQEAVRYESEHPDEIANVLVFGVAHPEEAK